MSIAYVGLFLTKESREKLLQEITPLHSILHADHVTLSFRPSEELVEKFRPWIGIEIPLILQAEYYDLKAQAVRISLGADGLPGSGNHITISTADGTPPKYSNELIGLTKNFLFLSGLRLTGIVDFFPRTIGEER